MFCIHITFQLLFVTNRNQVGLSPSFWFHRRLYSSAGGEESYSHDLTSPAACVRVRSSRQVDLKKGKKTLTKSSFAWENIRKHCDILPCSRIRKHKNFFLGPSTRSSLESLERFSPEKLFVILDVVLCATQHGCFYHWHWSLKGWQWNRKKFTIQECDCYDGLGIYTPGVSVGVFSGRESWLRGSPPTTQYLSLLWIGQNHD